MPNKDIEMARPHHLERFVGTIQMNLRPHDEKALHRMLSIRGNPTMKNLSLIIHTIENDLQLSVNVSARQEKTLKSPSA